MYYTTIYVYEIEFYYLGGLSYNQIGKTPFGEKQVKKERLGMTTIDLEEFMEFLFEF